MNDNYFNLEDEICFVAKNICSGIRSSRRRQQVFQEIKEHFEDSVYQKTISGISEEKAFRLTCNEFGDVSNIKQLLASSNNILSPNFVKNLIKYSVRFLISIFVYWVIRGLVIPNGLTFCWYYYIPSCFILLGFQPFRYATLILKRIVFRIKLKKICKANSYELKFSNSSILSVFHQSHICDFVVGINQESFCVKFLTCSKRKDSVRFLDETLYATYSRHLTGARFVDRRPGNFNITKAPDVSYTTSKIHAYSFGLPPEWKKLPLKKVLIIDSLPREITYIKGSGIETVDIGKEIMGCMIHSSKTFLKLISKL